MAILSALLSFLTRKVGQLVRALFGWSVTGLFGRLPVAKQTAVSVALVLSIVWPLLVVGCFAPAVAAWAVAFVPLHDWLSEGALRWTWIALAVVVPLIVGAITRWVSPPEAKKGHPLRTFFSGYLLTLGFAISFLITLVVVPALKLAAMAKRWRDEHVYCQVHPGGYREVVRRLDQICARAGLPTSEERPPLATRLATNVIKWFARGGLDPLVPDEPRLLRGEGLEVHLYPGDLLLRGEPSSVARVRAAILRDLAAAPAWLTRSPESQAIEDQITALHHLLERHRGRDELGAGARARVREVARDLVSAAIPFEDWTYLYVQLHRIESAIAGTPDLVDPQLDRGVGAVICPIAPGDVVEDDGRPLGALLAKLVDRARTLARLEIELARDDARRELSAAKRAIVFGGVAIVSAFLAATMLLVALALAVVRGPGAALVIGVVLVAGAMALAAFAWRGAPRAALPGTRERVASDVRALSRLRSRGSPRP